MSDIPVVICMAWAIAQFVVEKGDVGDTLNSGKLCCLSKGTFFIILCRLQQKRWLSLIYTVTALTFTYLPICIKPAKFVWCYLHHTPKLQCYLLQTWKMLTELELKLEKDTGFHSLPKSFCERLVTGMSESPVHGEEAALGKHSHIWGSSLFLLILKHTTLYRLLQSWPSFEFKLSFLPYLSQPRDSVSSVNFTYIPYMPFLVDFLPESWSNCMGHTELKNQVAISSLSFSHTDIYIKANF